MLAIRKFEAQNNIVHIAFLAQVCKKTKWRAKRKCTLVVCKSLHFAKGMKKEQPKEYTFKCGCRGLVNGLVELNLCIAAQQIEICGACLTVSWPREL